MNLLTEQNMLVEHLILDIKNTLEKTVYHKEHLQGNVVKNTELLCELLPVIGFKSYQTEVDEILSLCNKMIFERSIFKQKRITWFTVIDKLPLISPYEKVRKINALLNETKQMHSA